MQKWIKWTAAPKRGGMGMDATEFRQLLLTLTRHLREFADCCTPKDATTYLKAYDCGLLSEL
jgi:hypothetical protein